MQKGIYVFYLRRTQNDGGLMSFCCFFCCKGAKSSAVLIQICQPKKETNGNACIYYPNC